MTRLPLLILLALSLTAASVAGAAELSLRGASLQIPADWQLLEQVDAVTLHSATLGLDDMLVVIATGPGAGEQALADVSALAEDRMNARLPMLLEDHRRVRFKVGELTAKGHKGVGTNAVGEDLDVECGAAETPHGVIAVCAAGSRKQLRREVRPLREAMVLGGGEGLVASSEDMAFMGVVMPVPAGWNAIEVEGELLPFAYLSQKQAGSLRMAKLPGAVAALDIPWEAVAPVVASVVAGSRGTSSSGTQVEDMEIQGKAGSLISFRLDLDGREGWVVLAHPVGRGDLALLGISALPEFKPWFERYLTTLSVDAETMEALEMPAEDDLMEALDDYIPGASEMLMQYLQNLEEQNKERAEGQEGDGEEGTDDPTP